MDDLISRQDVLDYIDTMPSELTSDGRRMVRRIMLTEYIADTLPSAEPQIIRCKDCIHYHPSFCKIWSKFGTVQTKENGFCYMAERRENGEP